MNDALQQGVITHSETGSCNTNGLFCPDCFKEYCEEVLE